MERNNISVRQLLNGIPDLVHEKAGSTHLVDHYAKKLKGKDVFHLLLYGLLTDRVDMSLRVLETLYNEDKRFHSLVGLPSGATIDHSSIGSRLGCIKLDYFKDLYSHCCKQMGNYFTPQQIKGHDIMRFDSTLISISSKLLKFEGMSNGRKSKKKKASGEAFKGEKREVKFSVGFNGIIPKSVKFFKEKSYLSENLALGDAILDAALSDKEIAVIDMGLNARKILETFSLNDIRFTVRLRPDAKFEKVKELTPIAGDKPVLTDTLSIEQDLEVNLFHRSGRKTQVTFRLIIATILKTGEKIYFLTNLMDIDAFSASNIAEIYRARWEIEAFFKFLKQHFNLKHFMSHNENGIQVVLYVTLIAAMLIYIFKNVNEIESYKIAKLKFALQLELEITKILIQHCGGNDNLLEENFLFQAFRQ
jgi:Transposase DDE domain